jgi:hypothetical protein
LTARSTVKTAPGEAPARSRGMHHGRAASSDGHHYRGRERRIEAGRELPHQPDSQIDRAGRQKEVSGHREHQGSQNQKDEMLAFKSIEQIEWRLDEDAPKPSRRWRLGPSPHDDRRHPED